MQNTLKNAELPPSDEHLETKPGLHSLPINHSEEIPLSQEPHSSQNLAIDTLREQIMEDMLSPQGRTEKDLDTTAQTPISPSQEPSKEKTLTEQPWDIVDGKRVENAYDPGSGLFIKEIRNDENHLQKEQVDTQAQIENEELPGSTRVGGALEKIAKRDPGAAMRLANTLELQDIEVKESVESYLSSLSKQEAHIDQEAREKGVLGRVRKIGEEYKKLPLKTKLLVSAGLIGAASGAAFIGGAAGSALALAAFTGKGFQRALGGAATFVALEGVLNARAEKKGRSINKLETGVAVLAGALVGSGAISYAIHNIDEIKESVKNLFETTGGKPGLDTPSTDAGLVSSIEDTYKNTINSLEEQARRITEGFGEHTSLEENTPAIMPTEEIVSKNIEVNSLSPEELAIPSPIDTNALQKIPMNEQLTALFIEQKIGRLPTEDELRKILTIPQESPDQIKVLDAMKEHPLQKDELDNIFKNIPQDTPLAPDQEISSLAMSLDEHAREVLAKEEKILSLVGESGSYTIMPGDNIWKIIEHKLGAHEIFNGLNDEQKTHLIDALKDSLQEMPPEKLRDDIGISSENIHMLRAGETIDLSALLGNEEVISKALFNAENLSSEQMEHIRINNEKITEMLTMRQEEKIPFGLHSAQEGTPDVDSWDTALFHEETPSKTSSILHNNYGEVVTDSSGEPVRAGSDTIVEKIPENETLFKRTIIDLYGERGIQSDTWNQVKGIEARKFLSPEWEAGLDRNLDGKLKIVTHDYLHELQEKTHTPPTPGESTETYIRRVLK